MNNKSPVLYLGILFLGLALGAFAIKGHFSPQALSVLAFFLIFVPTLMKPEIGLAIIIVSMLFSPEVIVGSTTIRAVFVRAEDVILMVIILAWLMRTSLTKNLASTLRTGLTLPFFLYIGSCSLSTIFAILFSTIDATNSFLNILKYLEYFLLFVMVKDSIKSLGVAKIYVIVFLITSLLIALQSNAFIGQQLKSGTEFFRVAPPVETRGGGESGTLSGYLVFMMAIIGGLVLYSRSAYSTMLLIVLEILMFRALLYTLSRSSYIAVISMLAALVYFTRQRRLTLIYAIIIGSIILAMFMPRMVRDRVMTTATTKTDIRGTYLEFEESPQARIDSAKTVVFERIPQSPIFGHGIAKYFIDSQVFLTLCESGLMGFALLAWVLMRLFRMAKAVLTSDLVNKNNFAQGLSVGFLAGFIGLVFNSVGTNIFIIIKIMEPFWFIAAIVLALPQLLQKDEAEPAA